MMNDTAEAGPRRKDSTRVHNNKFGYRGVEWDASRRMFRARIEPATGHRGKFLGRYRTAEDAARAYDAAAREVYKQEAFLNFPLPGEKAVVKSLLVKGLCANGHEMAVHGYMRPDGRGRNCRACNSAASLRRYYRDKTAPCDADGEKGRGTLGGGHGEG